MYKYTLSYFCIHKRTHTYFSFNVIFYLFCGKVYSVYKSAIFFREGTNLIVFLFLFIITITCDNGWVLNGW